MRHNTRSGPTVQSAFFSSAREARLAIEIRRLRKTAVCFLMSRPETVVLGNDPLLEHLVSAAGFPAHDLTIVRFMHRRITATAICVPTRVWRDHEERRSLMEIKQEARGLGTRVVLVPQKWLKASRRNGIARAVSSSRNVPYSRADHDAVIQCLSVKGSDTLAECASALADHYDPYGAVLALVAAGYLALDHSTDMGPQSLVKVRSSHHWENSDRLQSK